MRTPTRRGGGVALMGAVLLACVAAPARAQPTEPDPVAVAAEGLFGELYAGGWTPLGVRLRNRTVDPIHGVLHVADRQGLYGAGVRVEVPVDLPPGEERLVQVPVYSQDAGAGLDVAYVDEGGRPQGSARATFDWSPAQRMVVVLQDPPRLAPALTDLDVELSSERGVPTRQMRVPVGTAPTDPASGDPRLPTEAVDWATVALLVASAPTLLRAGEAERAAIADWVQAGGRLLVFPRSEADVAAPWLRELLGPIEAGAVTLPVDLGRAEGLVPDDVRRFGIACGEDHRVESFGCSRTVGFGRVYVADYDGGAPAAIASGAPRELVRSVLAADLPTRPGALLGRADDGGRFTGGRLRRALDPNEGFRPALAFVALVLFLYVIVVGPLAFRWVQKKNAPTLALVTTPVAAIGCSVVLLVVGYVGKGVTMRYRRVTLVEAAEGAPRAIERRWLGLFSTRPGRFDLPPREGTRVSLLGDSPNGVRRAGPRGVTIAGVRAGLWETTFVREERVVDGPAVRFARDGRRLAEVVNDGARDLLGALVITPAGEVYRVGDVPAGGRASIPVAVDMMVTTYPSEPVFEDLARRLGIEGEDAGHVLVGLGDVAGMVPSDPPVLLARVAPEGGEVAGRFAVERDVALVRVTPRMTGSAVRPAPPPLETDRWGEPIVRPTPALSDGPPDAGADAEAAVDAAVDAARPSEGGAP